MEGAGGVVFRDSFTLGDPTLSTLEVWGAEYQESNALLVQPSDLPALAELATRERCPLDTVGYITGDNKVLLNHQQHCRNSEQCMTSSMALVLFSCYNSWRPDQSRVGNRLMTLTTLTGTFGGGKDGGCSHPAGGCTEATSEPSPWMGTRKDAKEGSFLHVGVHVFCRFRCDSILILCVWLKELLI